MSKFKLHTTEVARGSTAILPIPLGTVEVKNLASYPINVTIDRVPSLFEVDFSSGQVEELLELAKYYGVAHEPYTYTELYFILKERVPNEED